MEIIKKRFDRRGAFFSSDALLALLIILFVIIAVGPSFNSKSIESEVHTDALQILSTLKTSEIDSGVLASITPYISSSEQSVLESIAELQALGEDSLAESVAISLFDNLEITENIGVWVGGELIYSKNDTPIEEAEDVKVARKSITGVFGENTTGYSARAFLSSSARSEYFYLGGYLGDGNLSLTANITGGINFVDMELVISDSFDLYVNDVLQGTYSASPSQFEPATYSIPIDDFVNGTNLIEFRGNNLFIAGGFVKINYNDAVSFGGEETIYLSGSRGIINIYDGLYLPSNLSSMEIGLHMSNNITPLFVNLGNVTLYENVTNGEETVVLNDAYLKSLFGGDYSSLEEKTMPLRIGFENVSIFGITQDIDIFSVTDLSGSMLGSPMTNAKTANDDLIEYMLNTTGNRVGLVGYETIAPDSDFHEFSVDEASLKDIVANQWDADGATCICCGIEKAVSNFFPEPNNSDIALQVYYDFNSGVGSAIDSSGNGYDGVVSGNPTSSGGIEGNSYDLDGSGDYITVQDILSSDEGTISIWVEADDDDDRTIFDASNSNRYFFMELDNGDDLRFVFEDVHDTNFNGAEIDYSNIETVGWTHLVGVWRYAGATPSTALYVDGVLVDSDNDPAGNMPDFLGLIIGKDRPSGSNEADFDGLVDEFRVYSRALSLAEIQGLGDITPSCGNDITEVGEVCDGGYSICTSGGFNGTSDCNASCSGYDSCDITAVCGDGILNQGEECDYGDLTDGDGCSSTCEVEDRFRSLLVMSDGEANRGCTGDYANSIDAQEAIDAACDAYTDHGIVTHAVGFGAGVNETTLQSIASCGGGDYYFSDLTNLSTVFLQIAQNIITEYAAQTINATGDFNTIFYPDSYVALNYERETPPFGFIVTGENTFSDDSSGSFNIDSESTVLGVDLVSYSGPRWTQSATINGNEVYNLSDYGLEYVFLGDPYRVSLPISDVVSGTNVVNMTTGNGFDDVNPGSEFNKIIYTVVRNISAFSGISPKIGGCNWTIQLSNDDNLTTLVPSDYNGTDQCEYTTSFYSEPADAEDGYKIAVYTLLGDMDFDDDGRVDVYFNQQDLEIVLSDLTGIPFPWELEVQVRRWF